MIVGKIILFFCIRTFYDSWKFSIGYFTSVWVREAKGKPWLVLFDGGGAPPMPAENVEAVAKHMAQAPKVCPGLKSEK